MFAVRRAVWASALAEWDRAALGRGVSALAVLGRAAELLRAAEWTAAEARNRIPDQSRPTGQRYRSGLWKVESGICQFRPAGARRRRRIQIDASRCRW